MNDIIRQFASPPITLITGHYGSGKTEFAVNLALALAENGETALADLDIVNPYFRSREQKWLLEQAGIRLIATSPACTDADVPSLPPEILRVFQSPGLQSVIDVGGDGAGARVLARFRHLLKNTPHTMSFVLNANRPLTKTAANTEAYLRSVEQMSGIAVTGLVNNTHLCGDTIEADIRRGADLAREVSAHTGIPLLCHVAEQSLIPKLKDLDEPLFSIHLHMKKPWD